MDEKSKEDLELPKIKAEAGAPQAKPKEDDRSSRETAKVQQDDPVEEPVSRLEEESPNEEKENVFQLIRGGLSKAFNRVTEPISKFAEDTSNDYNFGYDIGLHSPEIRQELRDQGKGLGIVGNLGYYIARFEVGLAKPFSTSKLGRMTYGIGSMVGGAALGLGLFKAVDFVVGSASMALMGTPLIAAGVLVGGIYLMGEMAQAISTKADPDFGVAAKYVKYGTTVSLAVCLGGGMLLSSPVIAGVGLVGVAIGLLASSMLTGISSAVLAGDHAAEVINAAEAEAEEALIHSSIAAAA